MKRLFAILTSLALLVAVDAGAKITFPSVISDNMVLQQQTEVALWGKAVPGKTVTVKAGWAKSPIRTVADSETGKWSVRISTPAAGGPYEITVSDGEAVTLKNVLVGEVWFCSGQSNMEMPVKGYNSQPAKGATEFIVGAKASRPIRICNIKKKSSRTVEEVSEGSWEEHVPSVVAKTSATAYFFAEALQSAIDVPVGIIVSSWGGSSIETWIPREVIAKDFPEFDLKFLDDPSIEVHNYQAPSLLFNGQVAPLVPYTFKGMIWYQGETNRFRPAQYIRLQTAYVQAMRDIFQVPDAPFYFAQIAPFKYGDGTNCELGYFNEAQQKTLDCIPHSGMAVLCDIGEFGTIHPCEKRKVGQRLAYLAMRHDYGFDFLEADAPLYTGVEFKEGKAYVSFSTGTGLSPMGCELGGFEMAGADKVYHKAVGELSGKDNRVIVVSCAEVPEPVAVRYCFRDWSEGSVYNNYGIPVAPFRSDDWAREDVE